MLKLSEVCQSVGVTRRTLQEYAKIGLLEPTKKTIGGYWYYDDAAIAKLEHILIFVEAGYERKRIKEVMEMSKADLLVEYDKAITLLKEKKDKIDGMIVTLDVLKTAFSTGVNEITLNVEVPKPAMPSGLSFLGKLRQVTKQINKISNAVGVPHMRFMISYVFLLKVYSSGADEEKVRSCIEQAYEYGKQYIPEEYEDPEDLTDEEKRDGVTEYFEDILQEPEGINIIDEYFGEGTATGLMDLIHSYMGFPERDDEDDSENEECKGESVTSNSDT